ncbi:MAG: TetM/TetW/TetO/TetS family tetracycline resistance ribosomal protection protein [Lachnospiraceae bacterium]|nr:TetM/TetW/TetO/TetS family tetracycline resistance ribosomal protection protein [Lachnospiraceae bacterium]
MTIALLAHVDAGKTTLSEGMLYLSGSIRKLGRVDKKDAFLDSYGQERERGITIFSKQAIVRKGQAEITLLDTPGHVDFSAEMERTLQVLDAAVLVISGSDGVQGHTLTLWRLLKRYDVPVFLFVNKMDQPDIDRKKIFQQLKEQLCEACVDFSEQGTEDFYESIAVCEEEVLNAFLEKGTIMKQQIQKLIGERKLFPCFFGSALKLMGVEELMDGLEEYIPAKEYPSAFGARVFKITRDGQGNRLTHMKITGGSLKAREVLTGRRLLAGNPSQQEAWEEKVNQIRIYSGEKFEAVNEADAGTICAVTGLTETFAGQGLGREKEVIYPELSPVLCYRILLPEGCDALQMLPKLRQLEEEEPQLHIVWDEKNREIKAQIMGQVQIEVYENLIKERFGIPVEFGTGSIVYKETIANTVEGVGHFEPLRHYAEVHLLLEPGEAGSGLVFEADCSEDILDLNWQRLVLTHLEETEHPGVLAGAPVTDMKITLKSGRAHQKHTEGGDFRQATYRALRQGLMQAESVLLEPYYDFCLEVPDAMVGRAMTDLNQRHGTFTLNHTGEGMATLKGMAPMALLQEYQQEVLAYTKGEGQLYCSMKGYYPCHNTEEVLERTGYDPLRDADHPSASIFCAHGAGFIVEWDEVPSYMHLESCLCKKRDSAADEEYWDRYMGEKSLTVSGRERFGGNREGVRKEEWIGQDEIEEILSRTSHANRKENRTGTRIGWKRTKDQADRTKGQPQVRTYQPAQKKEEYLLVDGYNVIFAWDELRKLAERNLDGARGRLLDLLCNYQAVRKCSLIAVFDAYRLAGHPTETLDYHNIHVVYTKEAETADQYIEKFAHENSRKFDVTVATSDGLEQIIIIGEGCRLISSRELKEEMERASSQILEDFQNTHPGRKNSLKDMLPDETLKEMNAFRKNLEEHS